MGQDLSIGYAAHDRENVELYITESFTFRILEEKAAIFLPRAAPKSAALPGPRGRSRRGG